MMQFPDVRTDKEYSDKYLNENDKAYVNGYDHAVDDILESFFDNMDIFDWDVEDEDINLEKIFTNHPDLCERFIGNLKDYLESNRNEMVVSLIDNMDEKDYERNKNEVDL